MTISSLTRLLTHHDLTPAETQSTFESLFKNQLTLQQAKLLLLLLAKKGESEKEIFGCFKAIRHLEPAKDLHIPFLMDVCGTGADNSHSFNISTVSALVIAGAGGKVAKHGNRSITSQSGSSDLIETLGVKLDAKPERMIESIKRFGIGYFHAPFYHPIFSNVQEVRRQIKLRTIFNILGPLINPFQLQAQLIGVAHKNLAPIYAQLLLDTGIRNFVVCHSLDGMDELSPSSKNLWLYASHGKLKTEIFDPKKLGFKSANKKAYRGGNAVQNSRLTLQLLRGKLKGPLREIIILNAAAGLLACGMVYSFEEGIRLANQSLNTGSAYESLQGLKRISHDS